MRHLGLSNVTAEQVIAAHQVHPLAAVQGEYSLWTRDPERELLPVAQRARDRVRALVAARRRLPGRLGRPDRHDGEDFRSNHPRFSRENLAANRDRFAPLRELAASLDVTPAQLALAWLLHRRTTSCRSPAPARRATSTRTSPPPTSASTADTLARIEELAPAGAAAGSALL